MIHTSSLAYNPVAYRKQQVTRFDVNPSSEPVSAVSTNQEKAITGQPSQSSSSSQIQKVLNQAGLGYANLDNQSANTWAQKAVNAYAQNYQLSARYSIAESITGIDLYV